MRNPMNNILWWHRWELFWEGTNAICCNLKSYLYYDRFFSRSLLRNTMELIEICSCFCFNKKIPFFNCDKIMRQISRNVNWHCLGKYISQISAILFKNIFKEYFPCIFPRICTPGQICPIFFLSSDWQFQIFFLC